MDGVFGDNGEQFQMLLMTLEDVKTGICLFQSEEQSKWVEQIRKQFKGREITVHNIAEDDEKAGMPLISDFRRWAGERDAEIVIVYNIQLLGLRFGDRKAAEQLNFMRDQIQTIGKLFLLGVSPYFGMLLSRNARDLYSCIRYHFKFIGFVAERDRIEREDYREPGGDYALELEKYREYKRRAEEKTGEEQIRICLDCMDSWQHVRGNLSYQEKDEIRQMAELADRHYRELAIQLSDVEQIWILADTWMEMEEKERGFYWYKLTADKIREELGEEHELYADALKGLADYYMLCSDFEQSAKYCDQALRIYEKNNISMEGSYYDVLMRRAILHRRKSQFDQALAIYDKLIKYYTKKYGSGYVGNAICLNNIGRVYEEQDDAWGALTKYQEALNLLLASGEKSFLLVGLYYNISDIYLRNGDLDSAWKNIRVAKKETVAICGSESVYLIGIYNVMSCIWRGRKQPDKAIEFLEKALELISRTHSEGTDDAASTYFNMGATLIMIRNPNLAKGYFRRALTLRCKIYGESDIRVAAAYEGLALAFHQLSDANACRENLKKALDIYHILYKKNNLKAGEKIKELEQFMDSLE